MDLVQDAMLRLVQRYSARDDAGWGPLFHAILQRRIRDWYRRTKVRNRWRQWFGKGEEADEQYDPLESVADTSQPSSEEQLALKRVAGALDQALRNVPFRQQRRFSCERGKNWTSRKRQRRWVARRGA